MLIHSYVNESYVNGPGKRFVLWTQGCTKKCKNCFNPETWNRNGLEFTVDQILDMIENSNCQGLTLTGGDPMEQPEDLLELLIKVKSLNLNKGIILFTGYTLEQINQESILKQCLEYVDVLIDGKFEEKLRTYNDLRGSTNQKFYFFSSKIQKEELEFDQHIEVGNNQNSIYMTGFPILKNINLKKYGLKII